MWQLLIITLFGMHTAEIFNSHLGCIAAASMVERQNELVGTTAICDVIEPTHESEKAKTQRY